MIRRTTSPLLKSLEGVAEVRWDASRRRTTSAIGARGATVVVHLAAETGTGQSMYEIDRYVETNVGGTAKLLNLLANEPHSVRRIVVASSRAIYGEGAYRTAAGAIVFPPHRSAADMAAGDFDVHIPGAGALDAHPHPRDRAPASVVGVRDHQAGAGGADPDGRRRDRRGGRRRCGIRTSTGPGQSLKNPYTGILSIFSTLIRQGKAINIFEDGQESRDFVFIDDVVEATYLALCHAGHRREAS